MAKANCRECGVRPKWGARHRCIVCATRHAPAGDKSAESARRLAMVPEALRRKTVPAKDWPNGSRWCAACQTFVDLADVPKGGSRCKACASAVGHAAMVAKTYGLTPEGYAALLDVQDGKCAICRARPVSKRLAVDHDHKTDAVRGLLCSRCNHDLMGAAWDSSAMALALWHYINTPPTSGTWRAPELGLTSPTSEPPAPVLAPEIPEVDEFATPEGSKSSAGRTTPQAAPSVWDTINAPPPETVTFGRNKKGLMVLPVGSTRDAAGNMWRLFVGEGDPIPL